MFQFLCAFASCSAWCVLVCSGTLHCSSECSGSMELRHGVNWGTERRATPELMLGKLMFWKLLIFALLWPTPSPGYSYKEPGEGSQASEEWAEGLYLPWVSAFSKKTLKEIANSHIDEGSLKGVGAKFIMVGVGKQGTTSKLHVPFPCIQSSRAAKATQVNLVSTNK